MSEVLSTFVFGLAFQIASIIFYKKEKYTGFAVLKYFASYMYISLAYQTYLVILSPYALWLFVALVLACLGDIAISLNCVIEKYDFIAYYIGIFLYIVEAILFGYLSLNKYDNYLIYLIIGLIISLITLFIIFNKKDIKLIDKIFESILLISNVVMAFVLIGLLISNQAFSNILFTIGAILIGIATVIFVIDIHTEYEHFILKVLNLILRYLGQLLITISLVFIFY